MNSKKNVPPQLLVDLGTCFLFQIKRRSSEGVSRERSAVGFPRRLMLVNFSTMESVDRRMKTLSTGNDSQPWQPLQSVRLRMNLCSVGAASARKDSAAAVDYYRPNKAMCCHQYLCIYKEDINIYIQFGRPAQRTPEQDSIETQLSTASRFRRNLFSFASSSRIGIVEHHIIGELFRAVSSFSFLVLADACSATGVEPELLMCSQTAILAERGRAVP